MSKKNKPKMVTVQVTKSFNEGRVLSVGDRIEVHPKRAAKMEQAGYVIKVDPEAPYTHPAAKPEHQFKEVDFDEPETVEPEKVDAAIYPIDTVTKPEKVEKPKPAETVKVPQIPALDELTFLNSSHIKALKKGGIKVLSDVEGWDVDGIAMINGVSSKTAKKLMDAYNQYLNFDHNKDSDMVVKEK